jgi:hypothetical protein
MALQEENVEELPKLTCIFEPDNEEQKNYLLQMKDNFNPEYNVKYLIKSGPDEIYTVKLEIKGMIHTIEDHFDEKQMEKTIKLMEKLIKDEYKK